MLSAGCGRGGFFYPGTNGNADLEPCTANDCTNGTCIQGAHGPSCVCEPGYVEATGLTCEIDGTFVLDVQLDITVGSTSFDLFASLNQVGTAHWALFDTQQVGITAAAIVDARYSEPADLVGWGWATVPAPNEFWGLTEAGLSPATTYYLYVVAGFESIYGWLQSFTKPQL